MTELITAAQEIERRTGLNLKEDLIYPGICLDSMPTVIPFLLREDSKSTLLVRSVEKVSVALKNPAALPVALYRSYFMMDRTKLDPSIQPDLLTALHNAGVDRQLEVHGDMPLTVYCELAGSLSLSVKTTSDQPVFVYHVNQERVLQAFGYRDQVGLEKVAVSLMATDNGRQLVKRYFNFTPDTRYAKLATTMRVDGLKGLVVTNPLDIQELSGIGAYAVPAGTVVLFNGEDVWLATPQPVAYPWLEKERREASLNLVFKYFSAGSKVGVDAAMTLEVAMRLGEPDHLQMVTGMLRSWKESCVDQDLPVYILASKATNGGQEAGFALARHCLETGATFSERDVYNASLLYHEEFTRRYMAEFGLHLRPYFVNLHATSRTLYPSVPSYAPISPASVCLRFDAGVLVVDTKGMVRACSDVGRSLVLDQTGQELYERFRIAIAEKTIPTLKPGRAGKEIHGQLVQEIAGQEQWIKSHGLMHKDTSTVDYYRRDVGHLLGKQEPTAFHLDPHEEKCLVEGMVGDVEMPWLFDDYALGYEDMFLVTSDGGLNLTVD